MSLQLSCRITRGFYAFLTRVQVCASFVRIDWRAQRNIGVPSLFLPNKRRDTDDPLDTILEVHAIAPQNPRSWFMGEQVIEGMCTI